MRISFKYSSYIIKRFQFSMIFYKVFRYCLCKSFIYDFSRRKKYISLFSKVTWSCFKGFYLFDAKCKIDKSETAFKCILFLFLRCPLILQHNLSYSCGIGKMMKIFYMLTCDRILNNGCNTFKLQSI